MPRSVGAVAGRAGPVEARSVRHNKPVCRLTKPRNRLHHGAASGATHALALALVVPFNTECSPDCSDRLAPLLAVQGQSRHAQCVTTSLPAASPSPATDCITMQHLEPHALSRSHSLCHSTSRAHLTAQIDRQRCWSCTAGRHTFGTPQQHCLSPRQAPQPTAPRCSIWSHTHTHAVTRCAVQHQVLT